MRLVTLVENTVRRPGLRGEHGLAFWIETAKRCLLFDAGQSELAAANARVLGLELEVADAVVLSHGHYDHTGGLPALLACLPEGLPLYAHPAAFAPKFKRASEGPVRAIGMPAAACAAARGHARPIPVTESSLIEPGIRIVAGIPRLHAAEAGDEGFRLDPHGARPDPLADDLALALTTAEGLVVLLGCAHAGVINTLDYLRGLTPGLPLAAVIGGMHLGGASDERIAWTVRELRRHAPARLVPGHCTGERALCALRTAFGEACEPLQVGWTKSWQDERN